MRAQLTVESGQAFPPVWEFREDQTVRLGRNRGNTIVLKDQHASRWHAEIVLTGGRWILRDCGTMNHTWLNGSRVSRDTALIDGQEIRIGDTRLHFHLDPADVGTAEMPAVPANIGEIPEPADDRLPDQCVLESGSTILQADDLNALFSLVDGSLQETSPLGLVALALTTAQRQTEAAIAGFLSLEEDDPLPKMVVPNLSRVDIHLSRQLTHSVQAEGKTVRLTGDTRRSPSTDSLLGYSDALCVPVLGTPAPLGALHVYKANGQFSEHDVRFCEVLAGYLSRCLAVLRSRCRLEADNSRLRVHASSSDDVMVGDSPLMKQLGQQIRRLADRPKVLLICGESGAGKELVALGLHRQSSRREGPLVAVNCASLSPHLVESELFGHARGAFSGAVENHPGFFSQADTGTLFLDEIGELPEEFQAKLLRVLETGCFRPVGARCDQKADVRILAATNRDLKQECLDGRFRKDLFFRLGVEIRVPALRERRVDIPALVQHFLRKLNREFRRTARLTPEALEQLQEYHWPGNVRQLRSVLEYAVAMTEGDLIEVHDLRLSADGLSLAEEPTLNLKELEQRAIRQALRRTQGTVTQAARLLGIHRDTLTAKMKEYKIARQG
jgi:two-component system, NtrC family, response regulator HydG